LLFFIGYSEQVWLQDETATFSTPKSKIIQKQSPLFWKTENSSADSTH
jgi:hypothetical protein